MLTSLLNLFKKKEAPPAYWGRYSSYHIEFHRRYKGTYMLFGVQIETGATKLLGETKDGLVAQNWQRDHATPDYTDYVSVDETVRDGGNVTTKAKLYPVFEQCSCCRHPSFGDDE